MGIETIQLSNYHPEVLFPPVQVDLQRDVGNKHDMFVYGVGVFACKGLSSDTDWCK